MPAKLPSTTCVTRSRMKFRRMREVYWLEASASVIKVIENVTPTTVIIEPAIVDRIPRAPSAPTPNRRGQPDSHCLPPLESTSIKANATPMLAVIISAGTNQKLERRLLQNCLSLFMVPPSMNLAHSLLNLNGVALSISGRVLVSEQVTFVTYW